MSNPITRELQEEVLPYLVSAGKLRWQWFCVLSSVYSTLTDATVALAIVGFAPPLLNVFSAEPATDSAPASSARQALAHLPRQLYGPTLVVLVLWIILRLTYSRHDGQKRAIIASHCARTMRGARGKLHAILRESNPMPGLISLLEHDIRPAQDRSFWDEAWPWTPFAPGIDKRVASELAGLVKLYGAHWMVPDDVQAGVDQTTPPADPPASTPPASPEVK